MTSEAKRVTFRLRKRTVQAMDALVEGGVASSRNMLVETLVNQALRKLHRHQREVHTEKMYASAFRNPVYAAEQAELGEAFSVADAESAAQLDR